jgi:hypothetical protein
MTANDRRFLRSLRIAADEAKKEDVEEGLRAEGLRLRAKRTRSRISP